MPEQQHRGFAGGAGRPTCAATCKEQLLAGKTDDEIREYMVQRYGNVILFTPPLEASTAWVWMLPVLAVLAGLFIGVRIVRRRATLVDSDDSVVEAEETPR